MQPLIDKKKRTSTSGSRSKSKKSTNLIRPDQTVQLKSKPNHIFHNQDISSKIKTENSFSVNKSKGSRKNSKSLKRPEKQLFLLPRGSIKQSKDQSYLVSAQRKYSVNKITKTQATHMESEDIYKKLYLIKKQLSKLHIPSNFSIAQIEEYFHEIKQTFINVSLQPLQSIFSKLHSMYITPIQKFFNVIKPYEVMLKKKILIEQMILQQTQENQRLFEQLDPQSIEIIKLKQNIQKNEEKINEFKRKKKLQSNQFSMKKKKNSQNQTETAKFVDVSNSDQYFSSEEKDQQDFQRKLVNQYERTPVFQEQKKGSLFRSSSQNQKQNTISEALKNRAQKDSSQKDMKKLHTQAMEDRQDIEDQDQSQRQSEDNMEDEYLQNQPSSLKPNQQNSTQNSNKIGLKSAGVSFSFKLDIPKIDRSNVGFHDEFYSKLDEFSESWRNQALRQKRF